MTLFLFNNILSMSVFFNMEGISILVTSWKEPYFILSLGLCIASRSIWKNFCLPVLDSHLFARVLPTHPSVFNDFFSRKPPGSPHVVVDTSNPSHTVQTTLVSPLPRYSLFLYVFYILFYFLVSTITCILGLVHILPHFVIPRSQPSAWHKTDIQ